MRTDLEFLAIYTAIVGSVLGVVWLWHRQRDALVQDVGERTVRITPTIPAPRRPIVATVYQSKEAIKDAIIREYDASRTTVMRLRPDPAELERVWNLARRVGQNDRKFTGDVILQDHEPPMSRDLDVECYPVLSNVTKLRPETDVYQRKSE